MLNKINKDKSKLNYKIKVLEKFQKFKIFNKFYKIIPYKTRIINNKI